MGQCLIHISATHRPRVNERRAPQGLEGNVAEWDHAGFGSVSPHHSAVRPQGAIPNLSEPDFNKAAPFPGLEMVITAGVVQFTKRGQIERSQGRMDKH